MEYTAKDKRIYLRLGDRVTHLWHEEWGEGAVVEERTSIVPGGTCLVRLLFEDGRQRTFNNDLDHEQCCYFFGVRRIQSFDPFEARATGEDREPVARPARRRVEADPRRIEDMRAPRAGDPEPVRATPRRSRASTAVKDVTPPTRSRRRLGAKEAALPPRSRSPRN